MSGSSSSNGSGYQYQNQRFYISNCENCSFPTIWLGEKIIFPIHSASEPPNSDLPDEIKQDYEEARIIANLSPPWGGGFASASNPKIMRPPRPTGKEYKYRYQSTCSQWITAKSPRSVR